MRFDLKGSSVLLNTIDFSLSGFFGHFGDILYCQLVTLTFSGVMSTISLKKAVSNHLTIVDKEF